MREDERFRALVRAEGVEAAMWSPVRESSGDRLADALFGNRQEKQQTAAYAALTFGDLLFDMAAIDPRVIDAADFSRSEDLADGFSFSQFAERFEELSGAAAIGAASQLRGYVAEQVVAVKLVELGHQVSLPNTPNQPGFDLVVDGEAVSGEVCGRYGRPPRALRALSLHPSPGERGDGRAGA